VRYSFNISRNEQTMKPFQGFLSELNCCRPYRFIYGNLRVSTKLNRNDRCPCGSGKKYKRCCLSKVKTATLMTDDISKVRRYIQSGQHQQAISLLKAIVVRTPSNRDALNMLSALLVQVGDRVGAIYYLNRSLKLDPKDYDNYFNLGSLQMNIGDFSGARKTFVKASKNQPNAMEWDLLQIVASAPEFVESVSDIVAVMEEIDTRIKVLESNSKKNIELENLRGNLFPIAYYGKPTLDVQRRISDLMIERTDSLPIKRVSRAASSKIRVGFISGLIRDHTIGKLNVGLIQNLDRDKFTVVVIHLSSSKRDKMQYRIDQCVDEVVRLTTDTKASARTIQSLQLDVLHYLDIGMNAFTHRLAHFRLAPVQTTSWGHPLSSGIPTVDYFVTFGLAEPAERESHYSERLVLFDNPPSHYLKPKIELLPPVELPDGNLYGCLQSLFKLHPEFDTVLEQIVANDEAAKIVLIEAENTALTEQLKSRWRNSGGLLHDRTVFLPRMGEDAYMSVANSMHVLLDPPYFGSGNTLYESLCFGVPSVTWPGPFMRGRLAAAFYEYMGVCDPPVVKNLSEYAGLATRLVADPTRLSKLRHEIKQKSSILYGNQRVLKEFEHFFQGVVLSGK